MSDLASWTQLNEERLKFHSGTATYQKTFTLSKKQLDKSKEFYLDLGQVDVIAEVRVNGKNCGIAWKAPYRVELSDALKSGENQIRRRSRISG